MLTYLRDRQLGLRAFHGKAKIKEKYLRRVRRHQRADEIIHGIYWDDGKGCAVGCTIHSSDHFGYESQLGIPLLIAHLEDKIFEGLDNSTAKGFPFRFLEAIPVGADLSLVAPKFFLWALTSETLNIVAGADGQGHNTVAVATRFWQRVVAGGDVSENEWRNLENAVWGGSTGIHLAHKNAFAAKVAGWTAASAHYYFNVANFVAAVVDAACAAYDRRTDAARAACYASLADKLLELLAVAPVPATG